MIVYNVNVYVNPGEEEDFLEATKENHYGTRREEGNLRFDVLQSQDSPGEFLLYEVYKDEDAVKAHKLTPHYLKWRQSVEPMMAKKREGRKFTAHFPKEEKNWQS